MAKRKRLTVPAGPLPRPLESETPVSGSNSAFPPPIAQVAGEAAAQSALDEIAGEMQAARAEGRMIIDLPLEAVEARHIVRDRLVMDADEMESLKASLAARGQQTPIEVVALEDGRFGLISGFRRLKALGELRVETVKALVRPVTHVSDSYLAMVEENEIRANLSFYERAHLACEAARLGVYADARVAVQTLFAAAAPAKRSKILAFVKLHEALGEALRFPAAIPERLGLKLVAALEDPAFARRLRDLLRKNPPETPEVERARLEGALKRAGGSGEGQPPKPAEIAPGLRLEARKGRVTLSGKGVTPDLVAALEGWLRKQGG